MDVKTIFLDEELEHKVYMDQPKGSLFEGKGNIIYKLNEINILN